MNKLVIILILCIVLCIVEGGLLIRYLLLLKKKEKDMKEIQEATISAKKVKKPEKKEDDGVLRIFSGNTDKLKLPNKFSSELYEFESSNETIAEVKDGIVIAKEPGTAIVTTVNKTTGEKFDTTVMSRAGRLHLKAEKEQVETGQTMTIYPIIEKGVFTSISYTSSDPSIATVELFGNRGIVRGKKNGRVEIQASAMIFGVEKTATLPLRISERKIPVANPANGSRYTKDSEWVGDRVYFGHYEQSSDPAHGMEPILWRVLEVTDEELFLLSEFGLENRNIIDTWQAYTWETSSLRKYLNKEFLEKAFTVKEMEAISVSKIETKENRLHGTSSGNTTWDKVFLLSEEEVTNPLYGFTDDFTKASKTRAMQVTEWSLKHDGYRKQENGNTCWWLRSMGLNNYYASYIYTNGSGTYSSFVGRRHDGIRPAIRVDLSKVSFSKPAEGEHSILLANMN